MSKTPKELRAARATIVANARSKMDEIKDDTPEARAAEIEGEFDRMMEDAAKLERQATRLENLEAAERSLNAGDDRRPQGEDTNARGGAPEGQEVSHRDAFHAYLRNAGQVFAMDPEARAVLQRHASEFSAEQRAQIAGTNTSGGYLVPDEQMAAIVKAMAAWGPMYADDFCTVIKTDGGGTLPIPTVDDTGKTAEATATEGATLTDDGGKDVEFGRKDLGDYMIDTEWLRLSIQFITGSYENAERLIADLLGERLGKKANAWLTTGTGTSQPQGIVTGSAAGKTLASIAAITSDELVDLVHSVDPAYRGAPKFRAMFNDNTHLALNKLKDGQGNYLLTNEGGGDEVLRIGATKVKFAINQAMADIGANAKPIVLGDFGKFYVRKIGNPIVGAIQDKDFFPGFGMAGFARLDGVVGDTRAIKHAVCPAS